MAQLNFNALIPQGGPQGFYQGFEQGQKEQQANALASQKQAQEQELNALRMQQSRGAIEQQESTRQKQARAEKVSMFRDRLARAANPEAAREIVKMQYADPDLGPLAAQGGSLEQALAEVSDDPVQFERYKQQEIMGASEWLKSQMPKVTPTGDVYDPAKREFIRKPQAAPAPTAPVAVMGPDGRPTYVPREQAIGMTPFTPAAVKFMGAGAGAGGAAGGAAGGTPAPKPMTQVQAAARRDKLGKEFKSAQNALQTTQDVLDSIAFVKAEPGLSRATGFTGTMLPSIPEGAAASAETRLKNLEGKVTALGQAQAAATGAIGSIANQEWKILADQIAAIDRSKGTGPLLAQLELVELQAQGAMERIKDGYQRQFGEDFEQFPQFTDLPAPRSSFKSRAPAASGGLNAAEQSELDQLKARFGKK